MTTSAVRIEADLLVPGRGAPVVDGVVVLDGARIAYAGPAADAPPHDGPVHPGTHPDAGVCGTPTCISWASRTSTSASS